MNFSDLCLVHQCSVCVCVCVCVCHGSVPAFMCWKSSKRDCTSCDTHTLTAISHYTTLEVKLNACVCACMCVNVCVRVWLNAKALIERRERVIYSERQRRSSLLISFASPSSRRSSAHSSCSAIHTSKCAFIYYYYYHNLSNHLCFDWELLSSLPRTDFSVSFKPTFMTLLLYGGVG